jgi:hypothetical protein
MNHQKAFRISFYFINAIVVLSSCKEPKAHLGEKKFYSAFEYNSFLVDQQNKITSGLIHLLSSIDSLKGEEIEQAYEQLLSKSDTAFLNVSMLSPYESDSTYLIQARSLIRFYRNVFRKEYKSMIEIYLKQEFATAQDLAQLRLLVDTINKQETKQDALFRLEMQRFSEKYQLESTSN